MLLNSSVSQCFEEFCKLLWLLEHIDKQRKKDVYQRLVYEAITRVKIINKYLKNGTNRYGFKRVLEEIEIIWSQCLKENSLINLHTKFELY